VNSGCAGKKQGGVMRQTYRKLLFTSCLAMLVGVVAVACTDFSHPPDSLGHIQVSVVDSATNVGVGGITTTLYLEDKTTKWAELLTTADGTGEFRQKDGGVPPATYLVFVELIGKGYGLAANETNFKSVRAIIGQTATVTMKLHKGSSGGLPGT
jgi:hypothetical protein